MPSSMSVSIPCTLTVLLELKIYTVNLNNQPTSVHVQVKNAAGIVIAEGNSARQSNGRYVFSGTYLPPESFTFTATGLWSGTANVNVQRRVL